MENHNDTALVPFWRRLATLLEPTMEKHNDAASARVALLIDADNFSPQHAMGLFSQAAVYGNVIVRKAYGVMASGFGGWTAGILHQYAIEPVVRFHYAKGKNVADIALVIDAMELMRHRTVDAVCIASNDSDFSLLAMKLRENDIKVYGFGDERALASFVSSCDEFVRFAAPNNKNDEEAPPEKDDIPRLEEKDKTASSKKDSTSRPSTDINKVRKMLADACDSLDSDNEGWINLGTVTTYLKRVNAAFTPKQYGFAKMLTLVKNMPDHFEVKHSNPTTAHIRKKDAKGKKAK